VVRLASLTLDKEVADSSTFHKVSKKYLPLYSYNRSNPDLFGRVFVEAPATIKTQPSQKKHNAAASR
jgi:hypothetical protein